MTLIPDIGAAVGQTLFGAGGKPFSDSSRIPMIFTSLLRLRSGGISADDRIAGNDGLAIDLIPNAADINNTQIAIEMAVNPNSISFKQSKRIVKKDTQDGSVFFHFTNSKGENNDILNVTFKGNTGNLDLRSDITSDKGSFSTQSGSNTGAGKKLIIWQNLWALTREAMLLKDGVRNEFMIIYSSIGIPVQISLIGHYSEVLEFSENAQKPFSRDYSMSFTVTEIVPPLDELPNLVQTQVVEQGAVGETAI